MKHKSMNPESAERTIDRETGNKRFFWQNKQFFHIFQAFSLFQFIKGVNIQEQ